MTFEYAEDVLRKQASSIGVDITEIYMIGDNPSGDIDGANRMGKGWNSILVHTGIYKPEARSKLNPDQVPTYEVADMTAAVRKILEIEKLDDIIKIWAYTIIIL